MKTVSSMSPFEVKQEIWIYILLSVTIYKIKCYFFFYPQDIEINILEKILEFLSNKLQP